MGAVMCLGYYAWGNDVSGNVLDSLALRVRIWPSLLLFTNLSISYGIIMQCSIKALERGAPEVKTGTTRALLRLGLALAVILVAVGIPYFNEFADIFAAVALVGLNYLLPLSCYWALRAEQR